MNLKLNNQSGGDVTVEVVTSSIKEERRRNGRYLACIVGIIILVLAMYHGWVRNTPIIASVVIPALVMFVYIAWILYTAKRDRRLKNTRRSEERGDLISTASSNHIDQIVHDNPTFIEPVHNKTNIKIVNENIKAVSLNKTDTMEIYNFNDCKTNPIILVNDEPHPDYTKSFKHNKPRMYKRNFMFHKKRNVFKRSYTIS